MADVPACAAGCADGEYWRAEALAARAQLADDGADWRDDVLAARGALAPLAAGLLPRFIHPELLAYDDAPAPVGTGERLVALALVGPWLACSTGWAAVIGVAELIRWARR